MSADVKTCRSTYAAPAVDGMLDIVEHLAAQPTGHGITELSRELGLSTNLVFRILKRLIERGYVKMDVAGNYQLGSRFLSLGMKLYHRFDLRSLARPFLRELCQGCGETCQLQVPDGDRMLVAEVLTPDSDYFLQVVPGSRTFYHANAFGKCVLAYLPEDEFAGIVAAGLTKLTEATLTRESTLRRELAKVRRTGISHDQAEYLDGIYCIGAPVFDCLGKVVAGVGITGLISRQKPDRQATQEAAVRKCAVALSEALGSHESEVR